MENIGARIKNARLVNKLSQEELAHKVGYVSRSSINKIELGLVDLSASRISAIAKALGVSETWLLGLEDQENNPRVALTSMFEALNKEGQDLLLDMAKTIVASGRYKR